MKKVILQLACLIATFSSFAQVNLVGSVTHYTSGTDDGYAMNTATTCSGTSQACAVWNIPKISFYKSFEIVFYANFTIVSAPGGDGICAVFGTNSSIITSVNNGGGLLGYYDVPGGPHNPFFANSLGIEYDIFGNGAAYSDPVGPYYDHIMIAKNADVTTSLAGPVQADPFLPSIKDGVFRKYKIKWNCNNDSLYTYCNDSLRTACHIDPVAVFGDVVNAENVYWGFTSATWTYCSIDTVKNIKLTIIDSCIAPCFDTCKPRILPMPDPTNCRKWTLGAYGICPTSGVIVTLYEWNFGDGSGDVYTPTDTITHIFPGSGVYTVTLKKVIAYNTLTGECCEIGPFTLKLFVSCPPMAPASPAIGEKPGGTPGNNMTVFPNPTAAELNLRTTGFDISHVKVYNMLGKKLLDMAYDQSNSEKIDIQSLVNGTYIIEVNDKKGNAYKASFVVQK